MKYIVAVSGGVDSVVLLDMLVRKGKHKLVVAHFDHGIRDDSAADARFVAALAAKYKLPFETRREELGDHASEETARQRRYDFLQTVAKKHNATIVTAHHKNDLIETIAINLHRGTGWRGLAVFGNGTIERPLVGMTKADIYEYALKHTLEWVEDSTNSEMNYLRNQFRAKLNIVLDSSSRDRLEQLWHLQTKLRDEIDAEAHLVLTQDNRFSRYFYSCINEQVATELLSHILKNDQLSLTRPQRLRFLHAIKTAHPDSTFEAGSGVSAVFSKRDFIVKNTL